MSIGKVDDNACGSGAHKYDDGPGVRKCGCLEVKCPLSGYACIFQDVVCVRRDIGLKIRIPSFVIGANTHRS